MCLPYLKYISASDSKNNSKMKYSFSKVCIKITDIDFFLFLREIYNFKKMLCLKKYNNSDSTYF